MNVREKLVELIGGTKYGIENCSTIKVNFQRGFIEKIADHLIAHGVMVQEWISVKDRVPTIYDADEDNCVLAIHKASKKRYYHWRSVADNPFDFTHWMKTPQPPKGE